MKIILLKSVDKVGRAGETKEVAEGHARNFLIPKGLARIATPGFVAKVEAQKQAAVAHAVHEGKRLKKMAKELSGVEIKIAAKVGEGGKLYGSVGVEDVARELKRAGFEIDKDNIKLEKSIKDVGGHEVAVKLSQGMEAKVLVRVVGEK